MIWFLNNEIVERQNVCNIEEIRKYLLEKFK